MFEWNRTPKRTSSSKDSSAERIDFDEAGKSATETLASTVFLKILQKSVMQATERQNEQSGRRDKKIYSNSIPLDNEYFVRIRAIEA